MTKVPTNIVTIIDYGLGNLKSVKNALDRLKINSTISRDSRVLSKAQGLILPGVGSANEGMNNLKKMKFDRLIRELLQKGKPLLGICLGMQLLFDYSEEGDTKCLGVLKGKVKKFQKESKVPQIGWNEVKFLSPTNGLLQEIPDKSYFYYVNSYYCVPQDTSITAGMSNYGESFASIIVKDNIFATQFHPEKSGKPGFQLLMNFARRCL